MWSTKIVSSTTAVHSRSGQLTVGGTADVHSWHGSTMSMRVTVLLGLSLK